MKAIIGLICIIAGIALFFQGLNRRDSFAGQAAAATTSLANSIDGGARTPRHVAYMVGGGALALVGIATLARRRTRI